MRKLISFLIIIAVIFTISGCSSSAKPESTVSGYIEAAKTFDLDKMASKVNPSNTSNKENISDLIKNEENQFVKYFLEYLKSNAAKITYKIKDTKIDNNTAVVTVDFKYVDGGPLMMATIAEVFTQMIPLAFSGVEMTEEQTGQMFVTTMQKQQKTIAETYVEKTIDVKCIKVDNNWYIDEPSDDLSDVILSNFVSVGKAFSNNSANKTSDTTMEKAKKDDKIIIQKVKGEEITLATVKLKVNGVEEKQTISSTYGTSKNAKEGAKFIVVSLDITNITNKTFSFPPSPIVVDNKGREFKAYSESIGSIDNYLNYRDLSPSIKETGYLVYELPTDSTNYNLVIGKTGTNELYQILLK